MVASLFGSIFGIYIMFKIIKALVDNQAKVILDIFVKEVPLLIIILFFLKNIDTFNKYVQKPIKDTYNNIGEYLLTSPEDNSSLLVALADSMKDVMNTLAINSPSILNNLIMCVLIIVVLSFLFFSSSLLAQGYEGHYKVDKPDHKVAIEDLEEISKDMNKSKEALRRF